MNSVAFLWNTATVYWYSVVLALAICAGICLFMACCLHAGLSGTKAAAAALLSVVLGGLFGRLLYWNCRADSFETLVQALTTPAAGCFALAGGFFGCTVSAAVVNRRNPELLPMLDCMSIAGCAAIALGRLGNFFTAADRGQIAADLTWLPWAYPVQNSASGLPEYRFATFLFQALVCLVLLAVLLWLFFSPKQRYTNGDLTALFLLVYGASQVLLDSTRYDSLYLRSNGFVSMVQILAAVALAGGIGYFSWRGVKTGGVRRWMIPVWVLIAGFFGCAGYMEYYVQRHGRLSFFCYSVMEHCLVGIVVLSILLWRSAQKSGKDP